MELIRGNLLVFVTFIGASCYLGLWVKFSDAPFERTFSFLREYNRKKEGLLAVKLLAGVGVGSIVLYLLLCLLLKAEMVPLFYLLAVVGALGFTYLAVMGQAVKKDAGAMLRGMALITLVPVLCIFSVLIWGMQLDQYCGYVAVVLLLVNLLLACNLRNYWKRGDL
jgi:hypothetical protein